jgi:lipopolysaccharide/colanic/teichoic acid biosynthesis glycosyltransferase
MKVLSFIRDGLQARRLSATLLVYLLGLAFTVPVAVALHYTVGEPSATCVAATVAVALAFIGRGVCAFTAIRTKQFILQGSLPAARRECGGGLAPSAPATIPKRPRADERVQGTSDTATGMPGTDPPALSAFWPRTYVHYKVAFDFMVASLLLILVAPVILLCALAVKITSRGTVFYTQTRVGKGGRQFTLIKIRTMHHNLEKAPGVWWRPGDSRVTRVGAFLRRTHLDELPQLWNVLRGDMSLVGPRPERPEFIPALEKAIPRYRERLAIRPGVTGYAQVQLTADTDLASVRRKLSCDLYYIRHMSLWLDLRLIAGTVMVGIPFYVIGRILWLPTLQTATEEFQRLLDVPISRDVEEAANTHLEAARRAHRLGQGDDAVVALAAGASQPRLRSK